jgi:hypothetical protein
VTDSRLENAVWKFGVVVYLAGQDYFPKFALREAEKRNALKA